MSNDPQSPKTTETLEENLEREQQLEQKKRQEQALLSEDFDAGISSEHVIPEPDYSKSNYPELNTKQNIIPDSSQNAAVSLKDSVIRPGQPPLERPSARTSSVTFSPEEEFLKLHETPLEPVTTNPEQDLEQDLPKDLPKDPAQDLPKDLPKDAARDSDLPQDLPQGLPQNSPQNLNPNLNPDMLQERVSKIGPSASDRIRPTRVPDPEGQDVLLKSTGGGSQRGSPKKGSGGGKWFGLAFLGILAGLGAGGWLYWQAGQAATGAALQEFEVKRGMTLPEVITELERRKLISNATVARVVLRGRETGAKLHQGFFTLSGKMDLTKIAETLEGEPHFPIVEVLIPEGKRLSEIVDLVAAAPLSSRLELKKAFSNAGLSRYAKGTLEGFLFPAKYPFNPKASAAEITKTLVNRGNQEFTASNLNKAKKLGLSPFGWVILASMVQAEAGSTAEMPAIAGVFLNRLKIGMRLQSDPTIAYGLNIALPKLNRARGDFERETPYNTYKIAGLPKGPINNPGQAALEAAINPILSVNGKPAIYFLHGKNSKLYLNSTFNDHLRDNTLHR